MNPSILFPSEPEVKLDSNFITLSYFKEAMPRKQTSISLKEITSIKIKIHKTGFWFWISNFLDLISTGDEDDFSGYNYNVKSYERNDEMIIETENQPYCFTFHKNLKKVELEILIERFKSHSIKVQLSTK